MPPEVTTSTTTLLPEAEETYSPVSALVITIVSFLVAFLIFFLLYFHYYHLGKRLKTWIKEKSEGKNEKGTNRVTIPLPPPRIKRSRNKPNSSDNLHEISLDV